MDSERLGQVDDQASSFTVRLRNETLQLLEMFSNEYDAKPLSDMLHGCWIALRTPNNNPDFLPQVAHSIREFIENAHDHIVEIPVPIEGTGLKDTVISLRDKWTTATKNTKTVNVTDWSGTVDRPIQKMLKSLGDFFSTFTAEYRPRRQQQQAVLAKLDGSGQPVPDTIEKERLTLWRELDDFFKSLAHHNVVTTKDDLEAKIIVLEDFILDIKHPERLIPIETLDELDDLIAEGNAI